MGNYSDLIPKYECSRVVSQYTYVNYVFHNLNLPGDCESSIMSDFPLTLERINYVAWILIQLRVWILASDIFIV